MLTLLEFRYISEKSNVMEFLYSTTLKKLSYVLMHFQLKEANLARLLFHTNRLENYGDSKGLWEHFF